MAGTGRAENQPIARAGASKIEKQVKKKKDFERRDLKIYCKVCACDINFDEEHISTRISSHLNTQKHKDLKKKVYQPTINSSFDKKEENFDIKLKILNAFVNANIPLAKLDNIYIKNLLEEAFDIKIPHSTSYRRTYLDILYNKKINLIKEKIYSKMAKPDGFITEHFRKSVIMRSAVYIG